MRARSVSALLLFCGVATANVVSYETLTFAQLRNSASVIAVVHSAPGPVSRTVTVEVGVGKKSKRPVKPFSYTERHVVIDEVLKGDKKLVGRSLWIKDGGWQDQLEQYKLYYVHGISESPVSNDYVGQYKSEPDAKQHIVFLSQINAGAYQLVVQGAVEGMAAKAVLQKGTRPSEAELAKPSSQ